MDFCEETFCHPKTGNPKNYEPQKADFQLRFLGANQVEGSLSVILSQKVFDRFLLTSGKVSKKSLPIEKGRQFFLVPQFWSVDLLQCKHFCWVPTVHGGTNSCSPPKAC